VRQNPHNDNKTVEINVFMTNKQNNKMQCKYRNYTAGRERK